MLSHEWICCSTHKRFLLMSKAQSLLFTGNMHNIVSPQKSKMAHEAISEMSHNFEVRHLKHVRFFSHSAVAEVLEWATCKHMACAFSFSASFDSASGSFFRVEVRLATFQVTTLKTESGQGGGLMLSSYLGLAAASASSICFCVGFLFFAFGFSASTGSLACSA